VYNDSLDAKQFGDYKRDLQTKASYKAAFWIKSATAGSGM